MGCKGLKWLVLKRFITDQKTALRAGSKRRPVGPVASIIVENPETKNPRDSTSKSPAQDQSPDQRIGYEKDKRQRRRSATGAADPNSPIVPSSPATWTMNRRVA